MDEDYYNKCYICFRTNILIKCHRCVYSICEKCVLNEKVSTAIPGLCRHEECIYSYLSSDEANRQNCFVCSMKETTIEFVCGTCGANSSVSINKLENGIKESLRDGIFEKSSDIINQKLIYYPVTDIDSNEVSLDHFWEIP